MVTGWVELIPLFLEIGLKAFDYIRKLMQKKGRSDFESKLETANSILTEMEPLIERMKQGEGTNTTRPGVPEDIKKLIQTVEEGKQLVLECSEIKRSKDKKKYHKKVEEWIESFKNSLSIAMFGVLMGMASNTEQIKQHLLLHLQTPQLHLHLHLHLPTLPAHQQLPLSEEDYKIAFGNFIDCVNIFGGLKPLLQGVESVSTDKTEDAEESKQSVLQLEKKANREETSQTKNKKEHLEVVSPLPEEDGHNKLKRRNPEITRETSGSHSNRKKPRNNTVVDMRKVVLAVLARDNAGKKIVQNTGRYVKGVISAERVEQPNKEKDLVIVKGTKDLVVQDIIQYLKKRLSRKNVDLISDTSWEKQ